MIGHRYQVSRMDVKIMGPQPCLMRPDHKTAVFSGALPIDRKAIEQREKRILSPFAAKSYWPEADDRRVYLEEKDPIRPRFAHDRDRILHSKYLMLMPHKTQVFAVLPGLSPIKTTRIFHVLRVGQIARTIARAIAMNEDLVEAISLAHDLGHVAFGHAGEKGIKKASINDLSRIGGEFHHEWMSLRVVDALESIEGRIIPGLNLTYEVRDGISRHCGEELDRILKPSQEYDLNKSALPTTLEGCLVKLIDVVGYVPQDINDFLYSGYFTWEDIPKPIRTVLGDSIRRMYNTMVLDIIENSMGKPYIAMSKKCFKALSDLKDFEMQVIEDKLGEFEKKICDDLALVYNRHKAQGRDPQLIIDNFVRMTDVQMQEEIDMVKKAA